MKKTLIAIGCLAAMLAAGQDKKGATKGGAGNAAKGKEVFESNCSVCHNADSDEKKMGPGLKGLFKHDKLANGKKPTEANVKALIEAGGNGMPAYADMLTADEKANVLAYLKTL
jgi:mono/diheme cytochrome c family protein